MRLDHLLSMENVVSLKREDIVEPKDTKDGENIRETVVQFSGTDAVSRS